MRVLLYTGTGGAGTTTVAAATAVNAARRGTKALLVSTGSTAAMAHVLDMPATHEPAEVEPGLFVQQLDPGGRAAAAVGRPPFRAVLEALGVDVVAGEEMSVLPGVPDLLAVLELRDLLTDGPWDLVVVDCGPLGHAVRLLELPEELAWYVQASLPPERRVQRALRAGRQAGPAGEPRDPVMDAVTRLRGELADVRSVLAAPSTSVRLVLTPGGGPLGEALRAFTALSLFGYRVDAVVANRVFPHVNDPWRESWSQAQEVRLTEADSSFAPVPVARLPYLDAEPVGADALARLGQVLCPPDTDPLALPRGPELLAVERSGSGFVLRLHLPLVDKREIDLARRGDDLVLTVCRHRRHLSLPSALRRCVVVGASLRQGWLRIDFEPDPELWRSL